MNVRHKLLKRQVKRYLERNDYSREGLEKFVSAIDQAYLQNDEDREMLTRSLELSSNELLQSNSEMRAVFDAFPDIFFQLDSEGKIIDYMAGKDSELAVSPEIFLGKLIYNLSFDEVGKQFKEAIKRLKETQSIQSLEYSMPIKGKTKHFEARIAPVHDNQMVSIIRNISLRRDQEKELEKYRVHLEKIVEERTSELKKEIAERRKAELNLRFQKTLLECQQDTSLEGILLVSPRGKIISYNRRFLELWKIPYEIIETRSDEKALNYVMSQLKDPDEFLNKVKYLYDHPNERNREEVELKDGRIFERYSSSVKSTDGVVYGRVWFFQDISSRKIAEEQLLTYHEHLEDIVEQRTASLRNANAQLQMEINERMRIEEKLLEMNKKLQEKTEELEVANEEIKRFAYIVSHDLRAPLVNIKGFSSELQYALETILTLSEEIFPLITEKNLGEFKTAILEDIPEALEFIQSSTARMDKLINAILKLSRLGRRELYFETVDMNELIEELLNSVKHQVDVTNTEITIEKLPIIKADRTSMEQVMSNLLVNALKYLNEGVPGKILIKYESNHKHNIFHFQDNGRGIADHETKKIFELFGRAGKQDIPGEGMGLTYAKALVRRHGGKIWCNSRPGEGSIFSFSILKAKDEGE